MGKNMIRMYHPYYRYNILTSINFCSIIDSLIEGKSHQSIQKTMNKQKFFFCDCTDFTLWNCMYDNPDFFNKENFVKGKEINGLDLLDQLIERSVITTSHKISYQLNKNNPFERYKGNINQQIVTEAMYRKKDVSDWWVNQKFDKNSNNIKNTPYKYIQGDFLDNYFKKEIFDKNVLEIGC